MTAFSAVATFLPSLYFLFLVCCVAVLSACFSTDQWGLVTTTIDGSIFSRHHFRAHCMYQLFICLHCLPEFWSREYESINEWMVERCIIIYQPTNQLFHQYFFCSQQTSHGFCWCRSVLYQAPVFYAAPFFCLCELNCVGQFFCRCFFVFPVLAAKVAMCRFPHTAEWLARLSINQLQFFHLFFFFSHSCVDFSLTFQLIA